MNFTATTLAGAFLIKPELIVDERGFFTRSFCQKEFASHEISSNIAQCNISFNKEIGTLRGMHYQSIPNAEAKLVRCTSGRIFDVIIDLRKDSGTYKEWHAVELCSDSRNALFIPKGFAHGFQTLENDTEVFYQMFDYYVPESATGIRWNDPVFKIEWPLPVQKMSEKDRNYPDFNETGL